MERTGGEPDVVDHDKKTGEYLFYDCSAESPKGRRSVCYDGEALASRKEHKPADGAIDMSAAMGIELLTPFLLITATAPSSYITTVRNLTTPPGGSVAR
jgi:hypothetical protein